MPLLYEEPLNFECGFDAIFTIGGGAQELPEGKLLDLPDDYAAPRYRDDDVFKYRRKAKAAYYRKLKQEKREAEIVLSLVFLKWFLRTTGWDLAIVNGPYNISPKEIGFRYGSSPYVYSTLRHGCIFEPRYSIQDFVSTYTPLDAFDAAKHWQWLDDDTPLVRDPFIRH